MTFNKKENFIYELKAVCEKHNIAGFESNTKLHEVFGNVYEKNHHIVLNKDFDTNELWRALVKFLSKAAKPVSVDLDSFLALVDEDQHESVIGIVVAALEYVEVTPYSEKTKQTPKNIHNLVFDAKLQKLIDKHLVIAQAQSFARMLQDTPSNKMSPGDFEKAIRAKFADLKNVKISVLDRNDLQTKGFGCHYGVGKAAVSENYQPRLLVLEYNTKPTNQKYAFVGKGVCFDTGGNNIKTGSHMRWMKFDMSGAAIVASTLFALAKNNEEVNVVMLCPLVFNLAGIEAQRPDDVVTAYNGKTVEIDNTDAEGRLILCDALTYAAKDMKADKLIDIATLTGAMIYALGETYSGVWTTTDCLWRASEAAAKFAGELVWRLPFHYDFKDLLKSNVADIANSVSDPRGGSSRAAAYLKEFTEDKPYAHFDVAITADVGHQGTGVMLRTFYKMAIDQK
ncbi:leucyl aminopeptidase [Ureaplasma zalophigenitalium]|uniref:Probable cytosol aminopeptidase n=1 Tax=Ureaplasma zalophigenitalium TaxID=907723 RepID=A0ABT3BNQ9_9BACT|nr:leucyl aminopeptidase [Ureaplasma zalophigenitalium]MCV3753911.1 leucyl aminopeptidase [Ureaplasma zalophigenitalium]